MAYNDRPVVVVMERRRQMERSYTEPQCSDRSRVGAEAVKLKN